MAREEPEVLAQGASSRCLVGSPRGHEAALPKLGPAAARGKAPLARREAGMSGPPAKGLPHPAA
jgi:hypothetical protein